MSFIQKQSEYPSSAVSESCCDSLGSSEQIQGLAFALFNASEILLGGRISGRRGVVTKHHEVGKGLLRGTFNLVSIPLRRSRSFTITRNSASDIGRRCLSC